MIIYKLLNNLRSEVQFNLSSLFRTFASLFQGSETFFRTVISNMEKVYLNRNPTAKAILDLVQSHDENHICYDHFAFRTFGVYT
jgi:Domain of unknown function (DUF1338)